MPSLGSLFLCSIARAFNLLSSSLSPANPPVANLGREPKVFICDKVSLPTFLTEAALTIYSPLETIAGILSDTPLPAPTMGPPKAYPRIRFDKVFEFLGSAYKSLLK